MVDLPILMPHGLSNRLLRYRLKNIEGAGTCQRSLHVLMVLNVRIQNEKNNIGGSILLMTFSNAYHWGIS